MSRTFPPPEPKVRAPLFVASIFEDEDENQKSLKIILKTKTNETMKNTVKKHVMTTLDNIGSTSEPTFDTLLSQEQKNRLSYKLSENLAMNKLDTCLNANVSLEQIQPSANVSINYDEKGEINKSNPIKYEIFGDNGYFSGVTEIKFPIDVIKDSFGIENHDNVSNIIILPNCDDNLLNFINEQLTQLLDKIHLILNFKNVSQH